MTTKQVKYLVKWRCLFARMVKIKNYDQVGINSGGM